MSTHDDLLERVAAARPDDPTPSACEPMAVRTLARFAVLEAGLHATRFAPRRRMPVLRAAAVLAAIALPFALLGSDRTAEAPLRPRLVRDALWSTRVAGALRGDPMLQERVVHGGLPARAALLVAAERGGPSGRRALELLIDAGTLRGMQEAERLSRLAHDPVLRVPALALLARDLGSAGPRHLGALLVDLPAAEAEVDVVAALAHVAARGRRQSALRALLTGAEAGRERAAAAALRLGGASHLARVLTVLDDTALRAPGVVEAVQSGARTLRSRLVRLAARGDAKAIALAARAGVEGIVPVLASEAFHEEAERAVAAIDLLARRGDVHAHVALARALDSGFPTRARGYLMALPAEADAALAARAQDSRRDAPAAMRALAVRGAVPWLASLAASSRLAPEALRALGRAASPAASDALARLARRSSLTAGAVAALGVRLTRDRPDAGRVLLQLARGRHARSVLQMLVRSGPAGVAILRTAAEDPTLSRRAREALLRLPAARGPERAAARVARRVPPSRSI